MTFLSVLIVFVLVQWWGSGSPLHHDAWFTRWSDWVRHQSTFEHSPAALVLAVILLGPALLLWIVLQTIASIMPWLQIIVAVPLLLYSLGRGKFTARVSSYIKDRDNSDWGRALDSYDLMNEHGLVDIEAEFSSTQPNWPALHHAMLKATAYRGFERMFAVLFWFIVFGPVAALVYRLSALLIAKLTANAPGGLETDQTAQPLIAVARHWLWALEWPVLRVLGLTFALTGNFVSCIHNWQRYFLNIELPSAQVLRHIVYGALNMDEEEEVAEASLAKIFKTCLSLLSRTLILWICMLAVWTLV